MDRRRQRRDGSGGQPEPAARMSSGCAQQNPWLTIASKQLELIYKYMSELGLSPVTRSRVSIAPPLQRSKFAGLLGPVEPDEFFE